MGKPIQQVSISTIDQRTKAVNALFDSGAFYSIIHENSLPQTNYITHYPKPEVYGTATKGATLKITGETTLMIHIEDKTIRETVLISPELSREMIIGAKTMQSWHITVNNETGDTKIVVGTDMNDPEVTEVAEMG